MRVFELLGLAAGEPEHLAIADLDHRVHARRMRLCRRASSPGPMATGSNIAPSIASEACLAYAIRKIPAGASFANLPEKDLRREAERIGVND
jgi:hypothetical protein